MIIYEQRLAYTTESVVKGHCTLILKTRRMFFLWVLLVLCNEVNVILLK